MPEAQFAPEATDIAKSNVDMVHRLDGVGELRVVTDEGEMAGVVFVIEAAEIEKKEADLVEGGDRSERVLRALHGGK